jgi:hypothetical protein
MNHTQTFEKIELIESEIEVADFEDCIFNIYLCHNTLNILAKECCENGRHLEFKVSNFVDEGFTDLYKNNKSNLDYAMKFYKHEYLTYRLGRYTKDDEVSIGDVFMFGHYELLNKCLSDKV